MLDIREAAMAVSKFDATLLDLVVKRRSASNWRRI